MFCLRVIPSQRRKNVTSVKVNRESVTSEWVHVKVLLQVQQWRGLYFRENVRWPWRSDARLLR